jgi:protein-disulfide isomerase
MADSRLRPWQVVLDTLATLAVLMLCGILGWSVLRSPAPEQAVARAASQPRTEPPLPRDPVALDGAVRRGSTQARVVMLEFSDFECPFCGKFARETMPTLLKAYVDTGLVELAFRQLPLDIHQSARLAAVATSCAIGNGRFWEMHDVAFGHQKEFSTDFFVKQAASMGMPATAYAGCLEASDARQIDADGRQGKLLGVTGTPTFFVGVRKSPGTFQVLQRLTGAQSSERFDLAIASALKTANVGTGATH